MPTSNYYHNTKPRDGSPSKRWQTTTRASLEEVASHLKGNYDRDGMVNGLRDRKTANTKTSISFGNDKVNYISDAMENQLKCSGALSYDERTQQQERIRAMKAGLTTTNFKLGDEKPKYLSVNHESMAIAETFHGQARSSFNNDVKEAVKKSSIHFGNERPQYMSTAHEAMTKSLVNTEAGTPLTHTERQAEVHEMTKALRRHNFSFGDEKVDYTTDYKRGYCGTGGAISAQDRAQQAQRAKATIADQRSAHFSLGHAHERTVYETNTQAALRMSEGGEKRREDVAQQLERARAMKAGLMKTSIVIGDDVEYY